MRQLCIKNIVGLESLPTPSSDLIGVFVRLNSDNKPYYCDGTSWVDITSWAGDINYSQVQSAPVSSTIDSVTLTSNQTTTLFAISVLVPHVTFQIYVKSVDGAITQTTQIDAFYDPINDEVHYTEYGSMATSTTNDGAFSVVYEASEIRIKFTAAVAGTYNYRVVATGVATTSNSVVPTYIDINALDVFTAGVKGLVPASGGGTSKFARADGTWAEVPAFRNAAGSYVGFTMLSSTDSIQTAIDAVPNDLVEILTTGFTNLTATYGNVYSIPNTRVPTKLYIDHYRARRFNNVDEFLVSTVGDNRGAGSIGGLDYGWCVDSANNRILLHVASGVAPTSVTLRDDWLILLSCGKHQQRVNMKSGVVLQGPGKDLCSIKAPGDLARVNSSGSNYNFYSMRANAYCDVLGVTVIKAAPYSSVVSDSDSNISALLFQTNINCTQFQCISSTITDDYEVSSVEYARSITLYLEGTGSNCVFSETDIINRIGEDAIETRTTGFSGSIEFRNLTITGGHFFDGQAHGITFTNVYTCPALENGKSRLTGPEGNGGNTFLLNLGSNISQSGFDYEFAARNCKFVVPRQLANEKTYWAGWQGRQPILIENSDIYADELILPIGSAAQSGYLKVDYAKKITIKNSKCPPVKVFSLLSNHTSPLVPICVVGPVKNNSTTTALPVGCFSMTYENLDIYKKAKVIVSGRFASNTNVKTLSFQAGLVGSLSELVSMSSDAFDNVPFHFEMTFQFDDSAVNIYIDGVVGSSLFNSTDTVKMVKTVSVAAGQTFGFLINATGVSTGDISVKTQRIELG